jgi:adenosylcobinamide kinase/adenosylcobinamide-phosphate guanylyltransferase
MTDLHLVLGGARSGKSRFAEAEAIRLSAPVTFIATAEALDDDMRARIERHRRERPADWATIEAPLDLGDAVRRASTPVIVLDCLTVWTSNLLLGSLNEADAGAIAPSTVAMVEAHLTQATLTLLSALEHHAGNAIVVSNEVGLGVVPPTALGRVYRDLLGRANQQVAAAADRVTLLVAGVPLVVKPATH